MTQQQPWGPTWANTHKPGIVALRPLRLGDLYDGAFKAIRQNPKAMIGFGFVLQSAFVAIPALVTLILAATGTLDLRVPDISDPTVAEDELAGVGSTLAAGVGSLFSAAATLVLTGFVVVVIAGGVVGRRTSIGEAWGEVRGKLLGLIGAMLLVGLVTSLPIMVVTVAVVALAVSGAPVAAPIVVGIFGFLGSIAWLIFSYVKLRFTAPALILERISVVAAMRRSWALSRGSFWRILGISILTGIVVGFAGYILQFPFQVLEIVRTFSAPDSQSMAMLSVAMLFLGTIVAAAVTTPFSAGVTALLYVDMRIRLEGYDVQLLAAAQPGTAGGVPTPYPPAYPAYPTQPPMQPPTQPPPGQNPPVW